MVMCNVQSLRGLVIIFIVVVSVSRVTARN